MPFRVELFRDGRLLEQQRTDTSSDADIVVDATLNAVLRGDHGSGEFKLAADEVNDLGAFIRSHFDSKAFRHPRPCEAR